MTGNASRRMAGVRWALLLVFATAACGDDGADGPTGPGPNVLGTYELVLIDGQPLPHDVGSRLLLAETVKLSRDSIVFTTTFENSSTRSPAVIRWREPNAFVFAGTGAPGRVEADTLFYPRWGETRYVKR